MNWQIHVGIGLLTLIILDFKRGNEKLSFGFFFDLTVIWFALYFTIWGFSKVVS